ncbi:MAG: hypothetical protein AB7J40_05195 [Candidatus Altimarinota bacterium]
MSHQSQPNRFDTPQGENPGVDRKRTNENPVIHTGDQRRQVEQLLQHRDPNDTLHEDTAGHIKSEQAAGRLSGTPDPNEQKKRLKKDTLQLIHPFKDGGVEVMNRDELYDYFRDIRHHTPALQRFSNQALPQLLMAFNGLEMVLPSLISQATALTKTIENDSRRLRSVEEGGEIERAKAIESLQASITAQKELKDVETRKTIAEEKLNALRRFTGAILEAIINEEVCEQLAELLSNQSAEEIKDMALEFQNGSPSAKNPQPLIANPETPHTNERERKMMVSILQEYVQNASEENLSDFRPEELTFDETTGEFAIISRIKLLLQKNGLSTEERIGLCKLLRAFLECFKKDDIKKTMVAAFQNTVAPGLARLADRISSDRSRVNTGAYYRLRLQDEGHIPQTIKLGLKTLKDLRKKIREDKVISESNQQAILMILFYASHLMKPIAGRIPREESTIKYRKSVGRANRALTPLKEVVAAVENLYAKATRAAQAGRNEIIMVPDTINIQFSLLRSIREDISFSQNNTKGESLEQTIEGARLLGINESFDVQVLEVLKTLFRERADRYPGHQMASNISAEELIGFMLESNHDRSKPVYQQWVLQVLTRAASNMFPVSFQHLKSFLENADDPTNLPAGMGQLNILQREKELLQAINNRLEEIERMARQPENQRNPSFSVEKAQAFASGIMAMILFVPETDWENCGYALHFNYLIQIIENAARKTDTFFDDSLVKDMLDQMDRYSEVGTKKEHGVDEELDPEVAKFFSGFEGGE